MSFWSSIGNFFSNFFSNAKADPTSTIVGVGKLAAAAGTCYGMANGTVTINALSIGTASSLVASGIHNMGTNNNTGVTAPAASAIEQSMAVVAQVAPVAMSVVDQLSTMKAEAAAGQQKVDMFIAVTQAIASVVPSTPPVSGGTV